jgi:hypothetical protein
VDHWPEPGFPKSLKARNQEFSTLTGPLEITLFQALEIGAQNNSDFQTKKEAVFQAALALYLEQDSFRNTLLGQIRSLASSDASKEPPQRGALISSEADGSRQFKNGMELTTALAIDLATLLTSGGSSSIGIAGDASLSIPLLRGSARHIVTEPLQQAERNVVYAIMDFERFKKEFAVSVGSTYLTILKQLDAVKNTEEDYRSRIVSARRSRRLADAGRLKEIEVDQSVQTELIARQRWISARETTGWTIKSWHLHHQAADRTLLPGLKMPGRFTPWAVRKSQRWEGSISPFPREVSGRSWASAGQGKAP